jgi:TonB-linked SusC/RagA family outer membrane protein
MKIYPGENFTPLHGRIAGRGFKRQHGAVEKLILQMKLVAILLSLTLVHAGATGYGQEVTVRKKNVRIQEVFQLIEKQTGYVFFYNNEDIPDTRVSLNLKSKSLTEALDHCFVNQPLSYKIIGNTVAVRRKDKVATEKAKETGMLTPMNLPRSELEISRELQPIRSNFDLRISGKVTSAKGEGLPGVSILVKGTQQGATTDVQGNYSLHVSDVRAVLVFSYVGYVTEEVPVGNRLIIDVSLSEDEKNLEEVVVVGYGEQKKVNLTGAVDQITSKQLETKSVATLGQALQGIVPNLNVNFSDGNPVKNPSFNVRGGTSFSGGSFRSGSPLILVDGIPMEINNLNPADIESISVLKDAASAAIYGARAAYGVMLITTKKGRRNSPPKISYSANYQIQQVTRRPKLLNSVQYQEAVINAQVLDGGVASQDDVYKLEQVKNYFNNPETTSPYYVSGGTNIWVANIDPYKELLKESAPLKAHNLSVSGGSEKSNYYLSLGYRNQDGMIALGDDWRKTYNANLGFSTDITKWLTIDSKLIYTRADTKTPHGQGGYSAYSDAYFSYIPRIGWRTLMTPLSTPADSPVGVMPTHSALNAFRDDGNITTQNSNLFARIEGTVKLLKGLNFKTNFAYRTIDENIKMHLPLVWRVEKNWIPFVEGFSTVSKTFSKSDYMVYNGYFDYSGVFGLKHEIAAVAGFNQELSTFKDLTAQGNDLVTDAVPALKLATGAKTYGDNESHWAIRGGFVRFNYIYDNKYLLEMNGRYDGTSKFPQGRRFKFFPSFSAGWRVSEENFMKPTAPVLSDLKLRASYGSLGNQDVNNYAYIASYGLNPQVAYLLNGVRPIGIDPPGLVSSNLTWETATTINFGADFSLWHKLHVTYDWYKRTTRDILTSAEQLPSALGTSVPNRNDGVLETRGWELSTKWSDRLKNGLTYDLTFTLADNQAEVVRFSGNPQQLFSTLYEGKRMGEIWGYETAGLFQTTDEVAAAPSQSQVNGGVWRPGDVRYQDLDGDGKITLGSSTVANPGDRKIIGNSMPRLQFGIGANVGWKGLDFNMFWQGTGKRDYWSDGYLYWGLINGSNINGGIGNPTVYEDSWTSERTGAFYPAFKPATKNKQVQSRYLLNASFARLRNVTLGYSFSDQLLKKVSIDRLRVFVSGYNLLAITKVPRFLDPENMDDAYPLMRSTTLGLQINF